MNPDQLAELEEQRRFLLRSITDLDREHQLGDVDDHDFETLRDGYTARAASVLRAIEAGQARSRRHVDRAGRRCSRRGSSARCSSPRSAGWLVARTSGQRLPGQAITGGLPGDEVALKLAEARQLLGVDPQQAIIRYQQVRELDPDNAEALTYMGWLIAQSDASAAAAGAEFLRGAIKLDPTYADPHCFLAITSADLLDPPDIDTARVEAQACLDNNPPSQMIGMIQGFIDRLGAATTDAPTSTTTGG